jgi:hypothetical protein
MKTMILAAAAVLSLGAGTAFAQGTAGEQAPLYGQAWAANQRSVALANAGKAQNAVASQAASHRSASTSSARSD